MIRPTNLPGALSWHVFLPVRGHFVAITTDLPTDFLSIRVNLGLEMVRSMGLAKCTKLLPTDHSHFHFRAFDVCQPVCHVPHSSTRSCVSIAVAVGWAVAIAHIVWALAASPAQSEHCCWGSNGQWFAEQRNECTSQSGPSRHTRPEHACAAGLGSDVAAANCERIIADDRPSQIPKHDDRAGKYGIQVGACASPSTVFARKQSNCHLWAEDRIGQTHGSNHFQPKINSYAQEIGRQVCRDRYEMATDRHKQMP